MMLAVVVVFGVVFSVVSSEENLGEGKCGYNRMCPSATRCCDLVEQICCPMNTLCCTSGYGQSLCCTYNRSKPLIQAVPALTISSNDDNVHK